MCPPERCGWFELHTGLGLLYTCIALTLWCALGAFGMVSDMCAAAHHPHQNDLSSCQLPGSEVSRTCRYRYGSTENREHFTVSFCPRDCIDVWAVPLRLLHFDRMGDGVSADAPAVPSIDSTMTSPLGQSAKCHAHGVHLVDKHSSIGCKDAKTASLHDRTKGWH